MGEAVRGSGGEGERVVEMRKYIPRDAYDGSYEGPCCPKMFNAISYHQVFRFYCTRPEGHKGKCSWDGLKREEEGDE